MILMTKIFESYDSPNTHTLDYLDHQSRR